MSISFNVSYNKLTKKITTSKNNTIGDLVSLSCTKFTIPSGDLYHNNKKLDISLPIKFSNLLNNSKLELKPKTFVEKLINIKLLKPDNTTVIQKLSNSLKIIDLIHQLNLDVPLSVQYLQNSTLIDQNTDKTVYDLVGDVQNAVIRFAVVKDNLEEQRRIVEQQIVNQRERLRREREMREVEQKNEQKNELKTEVLAEQEEAQSEQKTEESSASVTEAAPAPAPSPSAAPAPAPAPPAAATQPTAPSPATETPVSPPSPPHPTIYKPSPTHLYENPDQDYEFNMNHAMIYQNLVKYKTPKPKSAPVKTERLYTFRIKFPNGYILQTLLMNTCKFGELVKEIDTHLTEKFISNYHLKLSFPPFKKFETSFSLNGTKLIDIPEFTSQILLIFEPIDGLTGNYLNDNQEIKDFNELPEIQLEETRDLLPDEIEERHQSFGGSSSKSKKPNTPKWLKLGK